MDAGWFSIDCAPVRAAAAIRRLGCGGHVDVNQAEWPFRECLAHERQRDVEYWNVRRGSPFRLAVVCVSVKTSGHRVARQRFFEAAAAEKWEDLPRLAFNGRLYRCVVQHGN